MFNEKTANGYQILTKLYDENEHRTHVIIKRQMSWGVDYAIGYGYDETDGTWAQGSYDYALYEDALNELLEVKFRNLRTRELLGSCLWELAERYNDYGDKEGLYNLLRNVIDMTDEEIVHYNLGDCIPTDEEEFIG